MRIQDLANSYQSKTDGEILQLATNSEQLTPEAQSVLRAELARRRLDATEDVEAQADKEQLSENVRSHGLSLPQHPGAVGEFVEEVLRVYRGRFWFFIKLVAPAVVVGYVAVVMGRNEGREIVRHLPRGFDISEHPTELLKIWLANFTGYVVSWTAFSFSFAAICSGVRQIEAGVIPSVPNSFAAVRERMGSFLRLSLLLFLLLLVGMAATGLLSAGVFWVLHQRQFHPSGFAIQVISFGFGGLVLLVLSRFGLAIPALVLDNRGVSEAMFRSDELTEGKWLTLAVLLAKSLVGGYIAAMWPFWLAFWIHAGAPTPPWFPWLLTTLSFAGVTVVEPTMFIGFALLYLRNPAVLPMPRDALNHQLA